MASGGFHPARARMRAAWRRLVGESWPLAALRVFVVLVTLGVGGLLFVSVGGAPIAASEGHWPVTRMLLGFAMHRAVDVRSTGLRAPALDDPARVLKGAGHYASGCMPCHGAPGEPPSPVVRRMLPVPPYLPDMRDEWEPEELFWIVRHGIKYTAMPGWTAPQRDDEVWAMVAFLQRLPDLDPAQYRTLAHGETARTSDGGSALALAGTSPRPPLDDCVRCHRSDGAGRGDGAFPRLAGQREAYLRATLHAYARGQRHSGIMQPAVAGLTAGEIDRLARHFATRDAPPPASARPVDTAAIARGRRLAHAGDPARRLPSCVECHGPGTHARNPMYPELAGQYEDYLALQLRLFRQGTRGGTGYAPIMRTIAARLDERDIGDLAAYYASLRDEP